MHVSFYKYNKIFACDLYRRLQLLSFDSILNAHTDLSLVFYHDVKDNQFKCHFEILQIAHSPEGKVEDHRTQNLLERGREVTDYPPICNGHIVRSTANLNESSFYGKPMLGYKNE